MTEQSRLRKIAWAIAPIWTSKFELAPFRPAARLLPDQVGADRRGER
jgi:hypothetical protein